MTFKRKTEQEEQQAEDASRGGSRCKENALLRGGDRGRTWEEVSPRGGAESQETMPRD